MAATNNITGRVRASGSYTTLFTNKAIRTKPMAAGGNAAHTGHPSTETKKNAKYAPAVMKSPWAKWANFRMPKISDTPMAPSVMMLPTTMP